jgi:hypothetical protein
MTCDSVHVTTRRRDASTGFLWQSDGSGTYTIQEAADAPPGTSVRMSLRQDCASFAQTDEVRRVLLKYSNFINFPVHLNGTRINTIDAIWTKDKAAISDEDHVKFFQASISHPRSCLLIPATLTHCLSSSQTPPISLLRASTLLSMRRSTYALCCTCQQPPMTCSKAKRRAKWLFMLVES